MCFLTCMLPFQGARGGGGHFPQGDAVGLGYVALSGRDVAMKNGSDKAKCPAYIPTIALKKAKCLR
jgi:hypothetical protein